MAYNYTGMHYDMTPQLTGHTKMHYDMMTTKVNAKIPGGQYREEVRV